MTNYLIAPAARQDLLDIISYIAARDSGAATRVRHALLAAFDRLSERPALGHVRGDRTALPVRFWTVARRYAVVYRGEAGRIEIARVFSAGQDIASLLG